MAAVAAVAAVAGVATTGTAQAQAGGAADGLIVKLRDAPVHETRQARRPQGNAEVDGARWQRVFSRSGMAPRRMRPTGRASQLLDFGRRLDAAEARRLADKLRENPEVQWVEPNVRERRLMTPNDPFFPLKFTLPGGTSPIDGQWWLHPGTDAGAATDKLRGAPGFLTAWSNGIAGSTGNPSAVVAVLDTGIVRGMEEHPELAGRTLPGYDFVSNATIANDGDGRDADPSDPGDWVDAADLSNPLFAGCEEGFSSWHGSIIAAMLAANTNNNDGMAAISWDGMVLPLRVAGKCGANVADIVDAMRWAAGLTVPGVAAVNLNPARVINISFGGTQACGSMYQDAIDELLALQPQGVIVVAAAGNEFGAPTRPANCNGALGVTALNRDGFKASYSNFGAQIAISTVGGDPRFDSNGQPFGSWGPFLGDSGILGLDNCGTTAPLPNTSCGNRLPYANVFGTSFSAPIVAGTAALMLSVNPTLSAAQLVQGLQVSARPHVTSTKIAACSADNPGRCLCTTATCGAGILDAEQALLYARDPAAYVPPVRQPALVDSAELDMAIAIGGPQDEFAQVVTPPPAPSGGGGGGAASPLWLLLLAGAVLALARRRE